MASYSYFVGDLNNGFFSEPFDSKEKAEEEKKSICEGIYSGFNEEEKSKESLDDVNNFHFVGVKFFGLEGLEDRFIEWADKQGLSAKAITPDHVRFECIPDDWKIAFINSLTGFVVIATGAIYGCGWTEQAAINDAMEWTGGEIASAADFNDGDGVETLYYRCQRAEADMHSRFYCVPATAALVNDVEENGTPKTWGYIDDVACTQGEEDALND